MLVFSLKTHRKFITVCIRTVYYWRKCFFVWCHHCHVTCKRRSTRSCFHTVCIVCGRRHKTASSVRPSVDEQRQHAGHINFGLRVRRFNMLIITAQPSSLLHVCVCVCFYRIYIGHSHKMKQSTDFFLISKFNSGITIFHYEHIVLKNCKSLQLLRKCTR